MQTTQGSLVIIGANTAEPQVFWNGVPVQGVVGIHIDNERVKQQRTVTLRLKEDPAIVEMRAAGINIRYGV